MQLRALIRLSLSKSLLILPTPSEPKKAPDHLRETIIYPRASGGDRTLEILDVVFIVVNPSIAGLQVGVGIGVLHSTDSGGSTCGGLKNTKI